MSREEKLIDIPREIELDLSDIILESDSVSTSLPPVMTEREIQLKECIFCLKKIGQQAKRCRYCLKFQPQPKTEVKVENALPPPPKQVQTVHTPSSAAQKSRPKPVKVKRPLICWRCYGHGVITKLQTCYICNGSGYTNIPPPEKKQPRQTNSQVMLQPVPPKIGCSLFMLLYLLLGIIAGLLRFAFNVPFIIWLCILAGIILIISFCEKVIRKNHNQGGSE